MKVTKQHGSMVPKTLQYEVDPEEGSFVYAVIVPKDTYHDEARRGVPVCVAHGDDCEHARAVADHLGA